MNAVLADTGPLYAAVDPDDQMHERARGELRFLSRRHTTVALPWSTLAEAYTLVLYRQGPRRAHRFVRDLQDGADLLNPSPADYLQALARLSAYPDQALSLFDGVLAVLAERMELPVWTYDQHFRILGVPVWEASS
jgi:predicted nucleic acid-binding protein